MGTFKMSQLTMWSMGAGLAVTLLTAYLSYRLFRVWFEHEAQKSANLILEQANIQLTRYELESTDMRIRLEEEILAPVLAQVAPLQEELDWRLTQLNQQEKTWLEKKHQRDWQLQSFQESVLALENRIKQTVQDYFNLKHDLEGKRQYYTQQLSQICGLNIPNLLEEVKEKLRQDWAFWFHQQQERQWAHFTETLTLKSYGILATVLSRFEQPYSPEKGIPYVTFNPADKELWEQKFVQNPEKPLEFLAQLTGCEVAFKPERSMIYVGGFDPVRREWARRVLEKLRRQSGVISRLTVEKIALKVKKDLMNQILKDGNQLAKKLKQSDLHPEIIRLIGALRYRYSYTQNQHFHVGEVGWLAGLLAWELGGSDPFKCRRSGLLHDVGKALDHEFEGGHAVIGADFIQQRGEDPDVVYAVRAHHYDVPPKSPMDFLVIVADTLSGARPGARRSMEAAYNQKVRDITALVKQFDFVADCYLVNGGRECRILLDDTQVPDDKFISLGQQILHTIGQQMTFPGNLKFVILKRQEFLAQSQRPAG